MIGLYVLKGGGSPPFIHASLPEFIEGEVSQLQVANMVYPKWISYRYNPLLI
jgi:hypothetical protein